MVRVSYEQKPYRRMMMMTWGPTASPAPATGPRRGADPGARIRILRGASASPSARPSRTRSRSQGLPLFPGKRAEPRAAAPDHHRPRGAEAVREDRRIPRRGHRLRRRREQLCRHRLPFVRDKIHGKQVRIIAAEPTSCPTLTEGPFAYDFGDVAKMTPLLPMHTLGHDFMPRADPRRRASLPRDGADREPPRQREGLSSPGPTTRSRPSRPAFSVGADRGVHPRPGDQPRHRRGRGRGEARQGRGQGEGHPLQLQRSRDGRSGLLRHLSLGETRSPTNCPTRRSSGRSRRSRNTRSASGDRPLRAVWSDS